MTAVRIVGVVLYGAAVVLFAVLFDHQVRYWDTGGEWTCRTSSSCVVVGPPILPAWLLGLWGLGLLAVGIVVVARVARRTGRRAGRDVESTDLSI